MRRHDSPKRLHTLSKAHQFTGRGAQYRDVVWRSIAIREDNSLSKPRESARSDWFFENPDNKAETGETAERSLCTSKDLKLCPGRRKEGRQAHRSTAALLNSHPDGPRMRPVSRARAVEMPAIRERPRDSALRGGAVPAPSTGQGLLDFAAHTAYELFPARARLAGSSRFVPRRRLTIVRHSESICLARQSGPQEAFPGNARGHVNSRTGFSLYSSLDASYQRGILRRSPNACCANEFFDSHISKASSDAYSRPP